MQEYIQGIITILSLVNPMIGAVIFSQAVAGRSKSQKIKAATSATLTIAVVLWLSALGGTYLLKSLGISLDAFQVAGGLVLGFMGFKMLISSPHKPPKSVDTDSEISLTPLILFAASPGTITGVITLSIAHTGTKLPITALVSITVVMAILWLTIVLSSHSTTHKKKSITGDIIARFMGLIVLAMGMQFALSGLKDFFS